MFYTAACLVQALPRTIVAQHSNFLLQKQSTDPEWKHDSDNTTYLSHYFNFGIHIFAVFILLK
jgi:hypothetical protein